MDTQLLRTFVLVARSGSFTATARDLSYVQSTVTAQLQALERHVGARLLDRLPRGAVPTEAGARLLPYAEQLLDLETALVAAVSAPAGGPAGRVRLVAPESLCAYRLPALLADLRTRFPGIHLGLAPAGTAGALEAVRDSTTEAALLLEPELTAADLVTEPLGSEELTLLHAPTAVRDGPMPTWQELAASDVLLLEEGCSYSDEVARRLRAAGQPDSRRTRFGSIEAVKRCVAAGMGWTVLPTIAAESEIGAGTLAAVPAPLPDAPMVHLVTHPDRTLTPATRLVLDRLRTLWMPPDQPSPGIRPASSTEP
ncbi:LysR substrate-binding domain-containing protein [Kocuria kalidii]|uniref:LysR family transcriptional regulator n=1 Tax=Kocuria kalidii TaxID=3376283 RepID=UPI00379ED40C